MIERKAGVAALVILSAAHAAPGEAQTAAGSALPVKLEEVVVTAEKRSANLQEVPASISVVGAAQLDEFHATQLSDIAGYVGSLQVDDSGTPGQTQLTIRGIPPLGSGATVAVYIDETPLGFTGFHERGGQYAADLLPYDVSQIEVLAGPQGTLYGANALGGLLKYELTKPSLTESHFKLGADGFGIDGAGNMGGGARGYANLALVPGVLGITASYGIEHKPGYIDNVETGELSQNRSTQQAGRLSALWQIAPEVSLQLGALYQSTHAHGNDSVALNPSLQRIGPDLTDNNYLPNTYEGKLELYNADLKWQLPWASLLASSSFSRKHDDVVIDATRTYQEFFPLIGGPADGLVTFPLLLGSRRFTQEVRLTSNSDQTVEWLTGLYYDFEHANNNQYLRGYDATGNSLASSGLDPLFIGSLPVQYREYAAYGNSTVHFTGWFDLGAGVRWARNDQKFQQITPVAALNPLSSITPGTSAEGVWTWSVKPRFHLPQNVMAYGVVSTGYQAGGPNTNVPGAPSQVGSSRLTNYEIGLKSEILDHRATVNASIFKLDWRKIQVPATTAGGFSYVTNGGTATSEGAQIDGSFRLLEGLSLEASATYTDAHLTQDALSVGGRNGDRLPFVPLWQGSVRLNYTQPAFDHWNLSEGVGLKLIGPRNSFPTTDSTGAPFLDGTRVSGYGAVDLNIALSDDRYTLRLFAKNVLDRRAYLTITELPDGFTNAPAQYEATVLQPRTVGLSLDVNL